jgi:hypothetical protein
MTDKKKEKKGLGREEALLLLIDITKVATGAVATNPTQEANDLYRNCLLTLELEVVALEEDLEDS